MSRIVMLLVTMITLAAVAGCPGRTELVEHVGGAPKQQLDDVKARVNAAEDKLEEKAKAAATAAATE
jgi:hypothetical protein